MGQEVSTEIVRREKPSYLKAFTTNVGSSLMVGGSTSFNRIGLKGSRFRLIVHGTEVKVIDRNFIDVVIVGSAPEIARIFFDGEYDPSVKVNPKCYSKDGKKPAKDVINPQSTTCQLCPQAQSGSKIINGNKLVACTFFKRIALILLEDPEHRLFQLDCKSQSVFGVGNGARNEFTLQEYAQKLKLVGDDPAHVVTRIKFDTEASVPKLYFSRLRDIEAHEVEWVSEAVLGDETKQVIEVNARTTNGDDAETQSTSGATETQEQEQEAQEAEETPVVQKAAPVKTPKPKPAAPAPKPRPAASEAPIAVQKSKPTPVVEEVQDDDEERVFADFINQLE